MPGAAAPPHGWVLVHRRPWRRLFRRTYLLTCWHCPQVIDAPSGDAAHPFNGDIAAARLEMAAQHAKQLEAVWPAWGRGGTCDG